MIAPRPPIPIQILVRDPTRAPVDIRAPHRPSLVHKNSFPPAGSIPRAGGIPRDSIRLGRSNRANILLLGSMRQDRASSPAMGRPLTVSRNRNGRKSSCRAQACASMPPRTLRCCLRFRMDATSKSYPATANGSKWLIPTATPKAGSRPLHSGHRPDRRNTIRQVGITASRSTNSRAVGVAVSWT